MKAQLAGSHIKYKTLYRDGKFGFIDTKGDFIPFVDGTNALKTWHDWCFDQETVDMVNVYLKLLED